MIPALVPRLKGRGRGAVFLACTERSNEQAGVRWLVIATCARTSGKVRSVALEPRNRLVVPDYLPSIRHTEASRRRSRSLWLAEHDVRRDHPDES